MKSISYSLSPTELITRYKMNYWPLIAIGTIVVISMAFAFYLEKDIGLEYYYILYLILPILVPIMLIKSFKEFNDSLEMGWNIQMDDVQLIIHRGNERDILSWADINKVMTLEQYRRRNNRVPYSKYAKNNTLVILPKNIINNLKKFKKAYILLPAFSENINEVQNFIQNKISGTAGSGFAGNN